MHKSFKFGTTLGWLESGPDVCIRHYSDSLFPWNGVISVGISPPSEAHELVYRSTVKLQKPDQIAKKDFNLGQRWFG